MPVSVFMRRRWRKTSKRSNTFKSLHVLRHACARKQNAISWSYLYPLVCSYCSEKKIISMIQWWWGSILVLASMSRNILVTNACLLIAVHTRLFVIYFASFFLCSLFFHLRICLVLSHSNAFLYTHAHNFLRPSSVHFLHCVLKWFFACTIWTRAY